MGMFSHTLAQSLAPDYLWPVLLLLAVLAIMGGLRALGVRIGIDVTVRQSLHTCTCRRIDAWQRARHFVRRLQEKRHRPKSHGHQ